MKIKKISHTAPLGETIEYQFRNIAEILFIQMSVNFHPINHIAFARDYIASIDGVRSIASVQITNTGGMYYFGLNVGYKPNKVHKAIENEFNNYFKTLDKNKLSK